MKWHNEKRKLSELKLTKYNPRKLDKKQEDDLTQSLRSFNLADPIVINKNNIIIGGHQRYKILKKEKITEIDVRVPDIELSEKQEKELNLRLNKNLGDWDFDLLKQFDSEFLLDVGFTIDELNFEIEKSQEIIEDDIPQNVESKAKLGDLFELGRHRLLCGDCTIAENVQKLLQNDTSKLMITDPPYGVNYDPEWRDDHNLNLGSRRRSRRKGKVNNDNIYDWSIIYHLFKPQIIYIWHAAKFTSFVAAGLINSDYDLISQIIWYKQHFVLSRGDYHWQHEPCWYAVKKGCNHNWQGARDQATVWKIKNNNFGNPHREKSWGHSTQKPIECMATPILNNSKKDEIIIDPFLGTGTTLIAAEQLNRICYGMEIEPNYIDIIIARWEQFTGRTVKLIN